MENPENNDEAKRNFFSAMATIFAIMGAIAFGGWLFFPENIDPSYFVLFGLSAALFLLGGYAKEKTWYAAMTFICPIGVAIIVASMAFDPIKWWEWASVGILVGIFLDAMKNVRKR